MVEFKLCRITASKTLMPSSTNGVCRLGFLFLHHLNSTTIATPPTQHNCNTHLQAWTIPAYYTGEIFTTRECYLYDKHRKLADFSNLLNSRLVTEVGAQYSWSFGRLRRTECYFILCQAIDSPSRDLAMAPRVQQEQS